MLKRVTFTGADDMTSIEDMMLLSHEYPFIEWGILLPSKGKSRFPSAPWTQRLVGSAALAPWPVQLAGHVCPPWTGLILNGVHTLYSLIGTAFERVQINTHGENYEFKRGWLERLTVMPDDNVEGNREYILQLDGVSDKELERSTTSRLTGLYDRSHGAGVLPGEWPKAGRDWIGYAGGLGPDNLAAELPKILTASAGSDIWIDMETQVRGPDCRFDLAKVLACCKIAKPYIL
jgi:hypothetical protein